ncbi:MAG: hypothetical protein ACI9CF_000088 [Candidatus Omnitrophota bacterium]|jgi:hypothetical protein
MLIETKLIKQLAILRLNSMGNDQVFNECTHALSRFTFYIASYKLCNRY